MSTKLDTSDLSSLARHLLNSGPRKLAATSRRVRVLFNSTYIVDTTRAVHVWEHDYYPQYYVPASQLQNCTCKTESEILNDDGKPGAAIVALTVQGWEGVADKTTDRVISFLDDDDGVAGQLRGLVRLEFQSMDAWLEEDVPIYVHPKDPYKRVDLLPSSRPVRVSLAGTLLAAAPHSVHLLETGLPPRFYLPRASVAEPARLRPSATVTRCPYKGAAEYFDVLLGDGTVERDLVWYYRYPTLESAGIAGLLCFYNERVDIDLNGVRLERPKTHFG